MSGKCEHKPNWPVDLSAQDIDDIIMYPCSACLYDYIKRLRARLSAAEKERDQYREDAEMVRLARLAIAALMKREGGNIEEWAEKLAKDVYDLND